MIKNNPHKAIIYWLLSGCALVYIMLVVGCLTRLTHSGLSIADWSFMDVIPPTSKEKLQTYFEKYQQSPEFKIINSSMTIDEFGSIFWWEWSHRFIGMLIGCVFMAGFVYFFLTKKFTKKTMWRSLILLAVGALQGVVGWWMVKSGLVKNPAVSHYRLAIHLITALTAFAFSFWFALEIIFEPKESETNEGKRLFPFLFTGFIALIFQIILGAFVAGLKAGLIYPTWPKMGNEWFPSESILVSPSFMQNFTNTAAGAQFLHRSFAWVVALAIVLIWVYSNKLKLSTMQYKGVSWLIYLTTVQIVLGIFTLLYGVPVVLGALHQTVAFALVGIFLFLLFQTRRA
ncbi:MAG: COX15/CtaA family protein [Bacteroidetes bacterium]|nr:COX15/CtaA family protein [Bacteroidota bacterium]